MPGALSLNAGTGRQQGQCNTCSRQDIVRHRTVQSIADKHACALQAVFDDYQEGDVVWVQDYHLMLLPALLKARHPKMKVCNFTHQLWLGRTLLQGCAFWRPVHGIARVAQALQAIFCLQASHEPLQMQTSSQSAGIDSLALCQTCEALHCTGMSRCLMIVAISTYLVCIWLEIMRMC